VLLSFEIFPLHENPGMKEKIVNVTLYSTGEVIESIFRTSGLWSRCTHQTTGLWSCDDYDAFFLGLPVPLQVS